MQTSNRYNGMADSATLHLLDPRAHPMDDSSLYRVELRLSLLRESVRNCEATEGWEEMVGGNHVHPPKRLITHSELYSCYTTAMAKRDPVILPV